MAKTLSTPALLIESLLSGAKFHAVDLNKVFSNAGLCYKSYSSSIRKEQSYRIGLESISPLLRSLWQVMGDESSGFLSRPFKIGVFSMMCHALISAGNLRRALLRSAKFIHLLTDELSIELVEQGDEAQLVITFTNPNKLDQTFFVTSLFVIWIRLSCWLIQKPMILNRIEFTFEEPDYSGEYSQMFPCRHEFSKPRNVVVFDRKNLSLPLVQTETELSSFLLSAPESLLTQFRSDDSLTAQVKRLLITLLENESELDKLNFEYVSQALHMTTHTLRRRLKSEGNSFKDIKDSIRRDQAVELLDKTELSILEVSEKLGFSEAAAFNRAFKNWTGYTPGNYRKV